MSLILGNSDFCTYATALEKIILSFVTNYNAQNVINVESFIKHFLSSIGVAFESGLLKYYYFSTFETQMLYIYRNNI